MDRAVFYEYPAGQRVYFTCRQQDNTTSQVDELVLGTRGQAEVLRNTISPNEGKRWRYRGQSPSMYVEEEQQQQQQQHFFKSIREGKAINNGDYMCNSTMIALMGRMAAYTGKTLTWEECLESQEQLGPAEYDWTDLSEPKIAIPGRTQLT